MKRTAWFALAVLMCVSAAWGAEREANCNREHNTFDDLETFTSQEQFTIPMDGAMKVTAAHNGGVTLRPGTGNGYEVTVCKYAGAENEAEGNQVLSQIHGEHTGSTISVKGPDNGEHRWVAHLIIKVPQGANMSVSAYNGPVSAKELNGTFELNTVNGPISVKNVSGKVTAVAKNGPIAFHGEKGDYELESQNGPLSIELENQSWQGGKLEAKSHNGPVSLALPKGYQSGVVLVTDGHGPMSCDAEVCSEARKTWDNDEKRIEFGPGNPVIKISTHNGPVSVSSRTHEEEM